MTYSIFRRSRFQRNKVKSKNPIRHFTGGMGLFFDWLLIYPNCNFNRAAVS